MSTYALSLSVQKPTSSGPQGASNGSTYTITPTSDFTIELRGVSMVISPPHSPAQMTAYVNSPPQMLQIGAPPGILTAGAQVVSSASTIAGQLALSWPIDVPAVLTLFGDGGQQLGQITIDPGGDTKSFSFPVDGSNAV